MELSGQKAFLENLPNLTGTLFGRYMQEQLEFVLNAMPVAVSMSNLDDFSITFRNQKFIELFGYASGEHETVLDWTNTVYTNPEQVNRAQALWQEEIINLAGEPFEIGQIEVDVRCKNGEVKTCLMGGMVMPRERWGLVIYTDISERKKYEQKIQKLALEDDLTGLSNRRGFNKLLKSALSQSRRHHTRGALMLIDMDDFKQLNDTLGHDAGDLALQALAEVIRKDLRQEDSAGRLGGDEFAVLLELVQDEEDAIDAAQRIVRGIQRPVRLNRVKACLPVSIGIAMFPEDGSDPSTLLKSADQALYRAKAKGKGCFSR